MAAFDPLSPEVTYALKTNIRYPGTATQAAAALTAAQSRLNDALFNPLAFSGVTQPSVTLSTGDIIVSD